jgi:succinate dehydrogenase/fumarate reductase cytochrome b subunit (b558 family)
MAAGCARKPRRQMEPDARARSRRTFLLRRLHSLSGVFPVGVFLVSHLFTNAKALKGQTSFDHAVADINHLPLLPLLEIFGIFLPLAFHAVYGVKLAFEGRVNVATYPYSRNVLYALQRGTGLIAFAFIGWHLWEFRVPKLLGRMSADAFYPTLEAHLSSTYAGFPVLAVVYLVGIAASVVHFANGLFTFSFAWGLCLTRRSQRLFATAFGLLGVIVFVMGAQTALYFATGAQFPAAPDPNSSPTFEQCSVVDPTPRFSSPPATSSAHPRTP